VTSHESLLDEAMSEMWYHAIELAPGRVTRGVVDLRAPSVKVLPRDLSGLRALDVGSFDGFWAFELERRGADVVAVDVDEFDESDWPPLNRRRLMEAAKNDRPGRRFGMAKQILRSNVRRIGCNIYDVTPQKIGGHVDFALIGALLLHLRDPVRGLEAVRSAIKPGGRLLVVEPIVMSLTLLRRRRALAVLRAARTDYDWWVPNLRCLQDWLLLGGFSDLRRVGFFRIPIAGGSKQWHAAIECRPAQGLGRQDEKL
jgi:SAM-dependent methyltransferase